MATNFSHMLKQLDHKKGEITSEVAEALEPFPAAYWAYFYHLNTRSEEMDFRDLDYLFKLYIDIEKAEHLVVEKSVQCGASELFIIQSHIEAGARGMTVMYVLPKYELRNRFVNNRIYKLHKKVPKYKFLLDEAEIGVHRASLMHIGKGTLVYVGSNVETEFLEIPVDSLYIDEKDRCNPTNLLMAPDRLTASPYKYEREISNPTVEGFGIDERYQESSQGIWEIRCDHCGKWFNPDFWKHVVRQTGSHSYKARDPEYTSGELPDARLMHTCGGAVDRLFPGHWTHAYSNRIWRGYRVSKIFSKFVPLGSLIEKFQKAIGNAIKTQLFYNSDLGLPFSSKGSKITMELLADCARKYPWPARRVSQKNVRLIGVDVGDVLHVIIRERVRTEDGVVYKLLLATIVPGFSALARIIKEWKPRRGVIDALPEIHKVSELKTEFHFMWAARFQRDVIEMHANKKDREVRMDRTSALDTVMAGFTNQESLIPMEFESIEGYFAQLSSPTRILEADEEKPEKSRFVWVHTKPDHYFLAEAYCSMAALLLPRHDMFEFFEDEAEAIKKRYARKRVKSGEGVEEKEKIQEMQGLTPETFLANMQEQYNADKKVKPSVDDAEIWAACEDMDKAQGYVDIFLIANQTEELEDDVRRVLLSHLYSESRVTGQYVR